MIPNSPSFLTEVRLLLKCPPSVSSMCSYFLSLWVFPKCKAIAGMKANAENTEMVTIATAPVSNLHGDWNIQRPEEGLLSEELTVLSEKGLNILPHHQASTSLTAPKSSPYFGQLHTQTNTRVHARTHGHTHTGTHTHVTL